MRNNLLPNIKILRKSLYEGKFIFTNSILEKIGFFIVFLILARTITKESYGLIVSIFVFTNILQSFFELGFPFYFQREAAIGNVNINEEFNSVIKLKLLLFPLFLAVVYLYFIDNIKISLIAITTIALFIYISGLNSLFNSVLIGKRGYKESSKILFKARIVLVLSFLIILAINPDIEFVLLSFIISALFYLNELVNVLKNKGIAFQNVGLNKFVLKKILKSSIPIGIGIIFVWIYDRADILLIQKMISLKAVAIYSIAYSLYKISQIISGAILIPSYNNISQTYEREKALNYKHLFPIAIFLLLISGILVITYNMLSSILISVLYGIKYAASAGYLRVLSFAIPGIFLNNFTGVVSNSIRKEKIPLIGTGVGSIICILFNILLIPKIGILGAVYSTIIVEYSVFFIQFILLTKHIRILGFRSGE